MKRFLIISLFLLLLVACGGGDPSAEVVTEQVEVEVTRVVEVEVEVTRLVEVVVTATPLPTLEPTPTPEIDPAVYVVGSNMSPSDVPPGEEGLVVVAAGAPSEFGAIPVVVRNNTAGPVYRLEISATARDAAGSVVGTGPGRDIAPNYIAPGGVAFGRILFEDTPLDGTTIEYIITGEDESGFIFNQLDMEIIEHNLVGGSVVGLLVNNHDVPLDLTRARVICFDDTLTPTLMRDASTDQGRVEAGAQLPFSIDLFGDEALCSRYLLAGSGYATD